MACAFLLLSVVLPGADNALSGRRAPGFSLPDRDFKRYDLQDYRGKVLLIELLRTDCPHCRLLSKMLEKVKAKYGDKLAILGVALPNDTLDTVARYIKDNAITVPIVFDMGQMAASYFNATPQKPSIHFPHVFVIDKQGMIRKDFEERSPAIDSEEALLKELGPLLR